MSGQVKLLLFGGVALVILAAGGVAVGLVVVGRTGITRPVAGGSAQPVAPVAQPQAPPPPVAPEGPKKFAVGESAALTQSDGSAATIAVADVRVLGKDIVVTVDLACTAGSISYNALDWSYVGPDGTPHEQDIFARLSGELNYGDLGPGQKIHGKVAFKGGAADLHGGQVVYSGGLQTLGYWVVP